jgi:hypothetical protein
MVASRAFVAELARTQIGETFNQYAEGSRAQLLSERLVGYLESRSDATLVLVGEAAGHRGARISGLAMTSERQLTGAGPAEATATIVHRVLAELGLEDRVLLWNVVPTHPGTRDSNRPPSRGEIDLAAPFLAELITGRRVVAVGRVAEGMLGAPAVRHPSHGGAGAFRSGLVELRDRGELGARCRMVARREADAGGREARTQGAPISR